MAHHTPIAEQRRLVARWRASGEGKSSFARSHHVHPNTFWSWVRRHGEVDDGEVSDASVASFIDVTPSPSPSPVGMTVRVGIPGEALCEVAFDGPPPAAWFASVLRAVASC